MRKVKKRSFLIVILLKKKSIFKWRLFFIERSNSKKYADEINFGLTIANIKKGANISLN